MGNYSVIFEGNISDGHQVQDVKKKLGTLFKIDEKRVDRLFAKPQVVLKKGLDYDSAQKYRHAIKKTGAVCNVKAEGEAAGGLQMETTAPPDVGAKAMKQSVPPSVPQSAAGAQAMKRSVTPSVPQSAAVAEVRDTAQLNTVASDETSSSSGERSYRGIGDIIAGIVIICIGFSYGGSVFLGNPGALDYFFDGLGVFWIGRGIFKLVRG